MSRTVVFVSSVLVAVAVVGCGAVSRRVVLETRTDSPDLIEAVARAVRGRGIAARVAERRAVTFRLDG